MNKIKRISFSLISILILSIIFIGCGNSNIDTEYDFRKYIAPSNNQVHTLTEFHAYSNESEPLEYGTMETSYTINNENNFTMSSHEHTTNLIVTNTKIISTYIKENTDDISIEIIRRLNINETIMSFNQSILNEYTNGTIKNICILKEYYPTKTFNIGDNSYIFNDILELECTINSDITISHEEYTETFKIVDKSTEYYSKNIGLVLKYNKDCKDASNYIRDDLEICPSNEHFNWEILTESR